MIRNVSIPLFAAALLLALPHPALADLKFCNSTQSRVGVSIGYQDCRRLGDRGVVEHRVAGLRNALERCGAEPVYLRPRRGLRSRWGMGGTNFMCTGRQNVCHPGVQDCPKRGYKRTGFFEVDTGEAQEWTVRLTDPDDKDENKEANGQ